jgi:hypothetical protein
METAIAKVVIAIVFWPDLPLAMVAVAGIGAGDSLALIEVQSLIKRNNRLTHP